MEVLALTCETTVTTEARLALTMDASSVKNFTCHTILAQFLRVCACWNNNTTQLKVVTVLGLLTCLITSTITML